MAPASALSRRMLMVALACAVSMIVFATTAVTAARADVAGDVAVTTDGPNRLDLWTLGPSGSVFHRVWQQGSGWAAWEDLGGHSASAPTALHFPDGHYQVYARGDDNALWIKSWYPSSGWTSWASSGNGVAYSSSISAQYSDGGNYVDFVGRDANNNLSWTQWSAQAGGTGWVRSSTVPGPALFSPALVDWIPSGQSVNQGDLFAVAGANSDIERNTNRNLSWGGWSSLGGVATSSPSADYGDAQLTVAVRSSDNKAYVNGYHQGGSWSGWQSIDGRLSTSPTIHYWPKADGSPRWVVIGRDAGDTASNRPPQIVRNEYSGGTWRGWTAIANTPGVTYYSTDVTYGAGGALGTSDLQAAAGRAIAAQPDRMVADYMAGDAVAPSERTAVYSAALLADNGDVTVTSDGANRLDLWTLGTGGTVKHKWWVAGSGWSGWENLAGHALSPPSALRFPDGHYTVYARGDDKSLWTKSWYPSAGGGHVYGWEPDWTEVDATQKYSSSIQVAYANGQVDAVGRDLNLDVVQTKWTSAGGWQRVGTVSGPVLTAPAIVDWTPQGVSANDGDVFSVGSGRDVITNSNVNLSWSGWSALGGQPTSQVYGDAGDGQLTLSARGADGVGAFITYYRPASGWSTWQGLGGTLVGAASVHYWPKADGTARWVVVGRDRGTGQIVADVDNASTWGGWGAIAPAPDAALNYLTSAHYDTEDHDGKIDTEGEIRGAVSSFLGMEPIVRDNTIDGITPGTEHDTVLFAFNQAVNHPTSYTYGGADFQVNTQAEYAALLSAIDAAGSDAAAESLYDGLASSDTAGVDSAFRARVNDGDYVRDISTSTVYYYAGGTVNRIPSTAFASAAGIDLGSAKRISHGTMSGWAVGPDAAYPTSWRYGGGDHSINTRSELDAFQAGVRLDGGPSSVDGRSLIDGVSPSDQAWLERRATYQTTITSNGSAPPAADDGPTFPSTVDDDDGQPTATTASAKCSLNATKPYVESIEEDFAFRISALFSVSCPGYKRGAPKEIHLYGYFNGNFYENEDDLMSAGSKTCMGTRLCELTGVEVVDNAMAPKCTHFLSALAAGVFPWKVSAYVSGYYIDQKRNVVALGGYTSPSTIGIQRCDVDFLPDL